MVAMSTPDAPSPVAEAHAKIQQANTSVDSVLAGLSVPTKEAVPLITDPSAKVGGWVRYIAMVQDIWDTELFVSSSPDGKSGLLVEDAAASDHPNVVLAERLPIYLVSLPGQTKWIRETHQKEPTDNSMPSSSGAQMKRSRDDTEHPSAAPQARVSTSRPPVPPSSAGEKRSRPMLTASAPITTSGPIGLNNPVRNQAGASAVVAKLYGSTARRDLRINSTVEVVGILQNGLDVAQEKSDEREPPFSDEFFARNPTNVKRLHVVKMRELEEWEINPMTASFGPTDLVSARTELHQVVGGMRELLLRYFASAMCNDLVAAEYVLMSLISRPVQAAGSLMGKLSVNIVFPSDIARKQASELIKAIRNVRPTVVDVDVSIAGLNSQELFPRKDYNLNRLRAGALQLANGSCFVGNETLLSDGQLAERGVKNVRALSSLSKRCQTPIDFQYYESEVGVNCNSIFISSGGKSIIPTDVVVRVQGNKEQNLTKWDSYEEPLISRIRLALALLAEDGKFNISDEATASIENEYVEARKNGEAKDGQESLVLWLGIARCVARSFGESTLTAERWKHARNLEAQRKERKSARC